MYPPPERAILEKLKNSPLEVVSFGLYVIHFVFENGDRLSISAPFRFSREETLANTAVSEFPIHESSIMRLLSHSIRDVRCDTDGSLELLFTNQDMLVIYANDPLYEAYSLLLDGQEYLV